jgi:hypothetical protein
LNNNNLTLEFILKHPDKEWRWEELSSHPNITTYDIVTHPDIPWYWSAVSLNPNITAEFVEAYIDKPWNWDYISCNEFIDNDLVCRRLMKKDTEFKRSFITRSNIVSDLAEIMAEYCSYL